MYTQGDIVLVPFPFTDQRGSKLRPALVISGAAVNHTKDIILVQITSNRRVDKFAVPIDNQKDLTTPLKYSSEIRCNKLLVAEQSIVVRSISSVKSVVLNKVIDKVKALFDK